jgi:hypothetical protein
MTTYNELIAYAPLATYAGNRDMITELPNMVRRAQEFIVLRLDHDLFASTTVATTIAADGTLNMGGLSSRFLEMRSVYAQGRGGNYFPLLQRTEDMLATLYPFDRPGVPVYYARLTPGTYRVYPRPTAVTVARYRANIAPLTLSPSVQSNILSTKFPNLMELALLVEVARFNLDRGQGEIYMSDLMSELEAANAAVTRTTRDETGTRPRDPRNAMGR